MGQHWVSRQISIGLQWAPVANPFHCCLRIIRGWNTYGMNNAKVCMYIHYRAGNAWKVTERGIGKYER